ncbi:MAG: xanthine dehydrogenase family protein [Acidobacteria bacterium]|nr:xanthine dehydrogenase family protein [Acidobacteriota bacterium]
MPRLRDSRLLAGRAVFIDDIRPPGLLHAHFLRSPHPHARIQAIHREPVLHMPGIVGVWTSGQLANVLPLRAHMELPGYRLTEWHPLAKGKVRFVGEAVAVVVATDRYVAEDAAECIAVDYVPLNPVASIESSSGNPDVRIHEELPSNLLFECEMGNGGAEGAAEGNDVQIAATFRHPRCTGLAIENRGIVAQYEPGRELLTVWSSTQTPDLLRKVLADCLGHPENRLRVIAPDVGGGFGVKMHVMPEELVVAQVARELARPIKWIEDRRENLLASIHARDHILHAEIVASRDGKIRRLQIEDQCDVGAYSAFPITCALEPLTCGSSLPGPYKVPNFSYTGRAFATNKCPVGAYRGVGFALSPFVTESLMDSVAQALQIDPAEVRRRNFIQAEEFPFTASSGTVYDSGDYEPTLDRVLHLLDYQGLRRRQQALRAKRRYLGVGFSSFVEPTGMGRSIYARRGMSQVPGYDSATVKLDPTGTVRAFVSTPSQGQGQETSFAQLLSEEMGFALEDIVISLGDTEVCPPGTGTFASRSIVSGGSALILAARKAHQKILCAAAHLLRVPVEELEIQQGRIFSETQPGVNLSTHQLAEALYSPLSGLPEELATGWEFSHSFSPAGAAVSSGTHAAVVEVDIETGFVTILRYIAVEDCGKIVNRTIVDGQIHGGVVQGVGSALFEDLVYDDQGQLLTATLMDYMVPGASEVPAIEVEHLETLSPLTPGGSKGVGESGTIASPAAICNAVSDALTPFGVKFTKLPITPQDVVMALARNSDIGLRDRGA